MMIYEQIATGGCQSYLLGYSETCAAVVIDPEISQAEQLASGAIDAFAAWRSGNQLLVSDFYGRTRSWLMIAPLKTNRGPVTRLYFGSAVVPVADAKTGRPTLGRGLRALLGFHKIYSKVLLYAAKSRLNRRAPPT